MMRVISRDSLLNLIDSLGIDVVQETAQDFIAYCPFHANHDTPAMNIGKEGPYPWRCWNLSCGESGSLPRLVERLLEKTPMEALRYIHTYSVLEAPALSKLLDLGAKADEPYSNPDPAVLDRIRWDWSRGPGPLQLLLDRGFSKETLIEFDVGYSERRKRITIPVFDENGDFVGISGRAIEESQKPKYWDKGVPKKHILFNLNVAKNYDSVIMVEGPLDAIKVSQSGHKNVVATFGGFYSNEQAKKLNRRFRSVIIFTDSDEAGRALAENIAEVSQKAGKDIYFIEYPNDIKDPGEMTEDQIDKAIKGKKSLLEMKIKRLGGLR